MSTLNVFAAFWFPALAAAAQLTPAPASLPEDVRFEIGFPGGRNAFRVGEPILVEFRFSSGVPDRYQAVESSSSLQDEFHIEPHGQVRNPFDGCFWPGGTAGSIPGSFRAIKSKPVVMVVDVSENYRFRPGQYQVSVETRRVLRSLPTGWQTFRAISKPVKLVVLPPDARWEKQRVSELAAAPSVATTAEKRKLAQQLSYLTSPAAAGEMIRQLAGSDRSFDLQWRAGLCSARDRAGVISLLRSQLTKPDTYISTQYLWILASLQTGPFSGDYKRDEQRHRELVTRATDDLTGSLRTKTQGARLYAEATLSSLSGGATQSKPEITADLVSRFAELPPLEQSHLLRMSWPQIRSAALIPALQVIAARRGPDPYLVRTAALERLIELAPDRAMKQLLAGSNDPEDWIATESGALLVRYAPPAMYEQVRKTLESRRGQGCWFEAMFLSYMLRMKPDEGVPLLEAALDRQAGNACWQSMLYDAGRAYWSGALETVAVGRLKDPAVAGDASRAIREFGSDAAKRTLPEFHIP